MLWRVTPHRISESLQSGELPLVTSPALLAELGNVPKRPRFAAVLGRGNVGPSEIVAAVGTVAEPAEPHALEAPLSRDRDDRPARTLAATARMGAVVSGAANLLALASYAGAPIVDMASALECLARER